MVISTRAEFEPKSTEVIGTDTEVEVRSPLASVVAVNTDFRARLVLVPITVADTVIMVELQLALMMVINKAEGNFKASSLVATQ